MGIDEDLLRRAFRGDPDTLAALQRRLRLDDGQLGRTLGVSGRTLRRWRKDQRPPLAALKLLAVLAGYLPWPGWERWECERGYLFPPGYSKNGILPGEFFAVPYYRGLAREHGLKNEQLQADLYEAQERLSEATRGPEPEQPRSRRHHRRRPV